MTPNPPETDQEQLSMFICSLVLIICILLASPHP